VFLMFASFWPVQFVHVFTLWLLPATPLYFQEEITCLRPLVVHNLQRVGHAVVHLRVQTAVTLEIGEKGDREGQRK